MKAIGYIVECRNHSAMMMDERDGRLYFGDYVTIFPTRYRAGKAITRTQTARIELFNRKFELDFGELTIKRVKPIR